MWFDEAVVYQIYPLGLCGAPREQDGILEHRILRLLDWIPHIQSIGADTVLLNPLWESDRHGYDTRDYLAVDCRLGTWEDLRQVCQAFHGAGLRVLLDGVFHHVGRGFWAFRDVQERRWDSPYRDWFHLNFDGDTGYHDGFWYEGWEGHHELVKLNLQNPAVVQHQFDAISRWVRELDIDGLRLDVAYCLPEGYLRQLRTFTSGLKPDFVLLGETLHGDYNRWMNPEMCHSVTNYECYKGLHSSFNSMNLFEIGHSLARQFGSEPWTLYKGKHLLSFLDNHDVERIASILREPRHLPLAYGLLFGMPGVPALYYGSEWGDPGQEGRWGQRPSPSPGAPGMGRSHRLDCPSGPGPAQKPGAVSRLLPECAPHQPADHPGTALPEERILVAVNADGTPYTAHFDAGASRAVDLLTGAPTASAAAVSCLPTASPTGA